MTDMYKFIQKTVLVDFFPLIIADMLCVNCCIFSLQTLALPGVAGADGRLHDLVKFIVYEVKVISFELFSEPGMPSVNFISSSVAVPQNTNSLQRMTGPVQLLTQLICSVDYISERWREEVTMFQVAFFHFRGHWLLFVPLILSLLARN